MMIDLMLGRAAFYSFFVTVFKKPLESKDLDFICPFAEHFRMFADESGVADLKIGAELLSSFTERTAVCTGTDIKCAGIDTAELLRGLNIAYTSLFLLGHDSLRYTESAFFSRIGLWKQQEWVEVREIYRQNRFTMPVNFKEPEDHISMELLFMAAMADLSARAIENDDANAYDKYIAVQQAFLTEHILKWLPELCGRIIAKSSDVFRFYESVAILLKGYLAYDSMALENFV